MTPHLQIDDYIFNTHLQQLECSKLQVVPKILKEQSFFPAQRAITRKNYQHYAQRYNASLVKKNKAILAYNTNVQDFIEKNQLQAQAKSDAEVFAMDFCNHTSIRAYNKAVEIQNLIIGQPLLQKKPLPKLRKAHENTLTLLLWVYAMQIDKQNQMYKRLNATTTRAVRKLKVNHHELSALTNKEGLTMLDYTKRTFHNHILRLCQSGVLLGYEFRGHQKPIEVFINDEILVLFDAATKKITSVENQLFKFQSKKNFHNNNLVTRTYINNIKIIEPVEKQSQSKGFLIQSPKGDNKNNNKNTNARNQKIQSTERQTSGEIFSENSAFLYGLIEDAGHLLKDATNHKYDNYRLTFKRHLEREAIRGELTREEFRELLLQTFVKMACPIWATTTPSYPSWRKAYRFLDENELLNLNGTIPNKDNLFYKFSNLVFRITYAKRYKNAYPDYQFLYPSQYFDPTRKFGKKDGGFNYTIEALKRNEAYKQNSQRIKAMHQAKAKKRNSKYAAIEKVEKKIVQYKNGKVTLNGLFDYVNQNQSIPKEVSENLHHYVHRAYQPFYKNKTQN